jgi:hypothetical protein
MATTCLSHMKLLLLIQIMILILKLILTVILLLLLLILLQLRHATPILGPNTLSKYKCSNLLSVLYCSGGCHQTSVRLFLITIFFAFQGLFNFGEHKILTPLVLWKQEGHCIVIYTVELKAPMQCGLVCVCVTERERLGNDTIPRRLEPLPKLYACL